MKVLAIFAQVVVTLGAMWYMMRQCRKPKGPLGRFIIRSMNQSHAALISWGLTHVQVGSSDTVLDVGCGGGVAIEMLATMADRGSVHGVDYSAASVAAARSRNRSALESGRVTIELGSVSRLPFSDDRFDLVTAFETHYYWPDLVADLREIRRVLKPGGTLLIIAELYLKPNFGRLDKLAMKPHGGTLHTPDQHRDLFVSAGYSDVQVFLDAAKSWICVKGKK